MNNVKERFRKALDQLLAGQGYTANKGGLYKKKAFSGFEYHLKVIFYGSVDIQITPLFGLYSFDVERCLKRSELADIFPKKYAVDLPTIFKEVDHFSRAAGVNGSVYPRLINGDELDAASQVCAILEQTEEKLKDAGDILPVLTDFKNFAVGHHAYRIPLLLAFLNHTDLAQNYKQYIDNLRVIPNYASNMAMVESFCVNPS